MKKNYFSKLLALVVCLSMSFTLTYGQGTLEITAPAGVAGTYAGGSSVLFGDVGGSVTGEIVLATDVDGLNTGCVAIDNGVTDVTGKIALIDRGACAFSQKAFNAELAGAIGVIICNNDTANPDAIGNLGGFQCGITIPVGMISYNDCQALRVETGVMGTFTSDIPRSQPNEYIGNAIEITDGTYTVDSISGVGGLFDGATGNVFYSYTAAADGALNINSCLGGADTRLIVIDCLGNVLGSNDDACDLGNGDLYASSLDLIVREGQQVFLVWDDRWSNLGFDFTVTLNPLPAVDVTFTVDMSTQTVSGDGVNMVWAFNDAASIDDVEVLALTDNGDGTWSGTATLTALDTLGYAFMNGALDPVNIEAVPDDCGLPSGFGFNIRPLIVESLEPVELEKVCFASCEALCPVPVNVTFTVDASTLTVSGDGMKMVWAFSDAASIDDVEVVDLTDNGDGTWSGTVGLTALDTIGYAFMNGALDPANIEAVPDDCGLPSGFGFNIRPLIVESLEPVELEKVCFASCEALCPVPVNVTFTVDASTLTVSGDGMKMVWAFSDAASIDDVEVVDLTDNGDGTWSGTVGLTALDTIGYAFMNGALDPANIEAVPDDCGLPSGFGFNIRPLIVDSEEDFALPNVCFSTCDEFCIPEITCDEPFVFFADDIEGLTPGDATGQTGWWGAWPGASIGGEVSSEQANSGSQSIKVAGSISGQDVLLNFGDKTEGHYLIYWNMYIPEGNNAYFNLQHQAPTSAAGYWAFDVFFEDGAGRLELNDGSGTRDFDFPSGEWFPIRIFVDIDNDVARLIVGEFFVEQWQFSTGVTNGGAPFPLNQLNSINFYPIDGANLYYVDDVNFWQIPEAGEGQYCYTATDIAPGTHSFDELSCFGGGHDLRNPLTTVTGLKAAWYTYTPTEDGIITVSSCNGAADSRVWVFEGSCDDLKIVGINDDRCLQSNGDPYASYREVVATAGSTYYIMWDDVWDATGSGWVLAFDAVEPAEGLFCQSAAVIDPGVHSVTEYGNAAVAGPNINTFTSSTTPYAGSAWYSYTPEADGTITITSCDAAVDTRVWVYTGTCDNFETLELVASDDEGCSPASIIDGLEVTAGTTYYIEWDDEFYLEGFDWELIFMEPLVTVTLNVDMSLVDMVSPAGVHVAGNFQGWTPDATPLTDNGDGTWSVEVAVTPNQELQYKFLNGDAWGTDEINITEECGVDGGSGSFNRVLEVGEEDIATPFYCFDYCITCQEVSVDDLTLEAGVHIFPNPASSLLNVRVDLPEAAGNLSVRMLNAFGQVVKESYYGSLQTANIEINVSDLPAGAYMIQVMDGKAQFTQAVIVE